MEVTAAVRRLRRQASLRISQRSGNGLGVVQDDERTGPI